jgi:hypothetical protein
MDSQYLQRQRFQLQKRVRRLNSCSHALFHSSIVQFWHYLHEQPLFAGVLAKLEAQAPSHADDIAELNSQQGVHNFATEGEMLDYCFRVLEYCARQPLVLNGYPASPEVSIAYAVSNEKQHDDALNGFREFFLEPFYEYLDDALDQPAAVLSLLTKYKKRVEWFYREELQSVATQGERALARHLYAYLHDQGLEFSIEPQSASGEADLVSKDLVLEAKVFDGVGRGVAYLASGVHQLHTYARDFNQTCGYLVVYRTCPEDLHFEFATQDSLFPFLTVAGKTIYIVMIDICPHEASASKRGTLKAVSVNAIVLMQAEAATNQIGSG